MKFFSIILLFIILNRPLVYSQESPVTDDSYQIDYEEEADTPDEPVEEKKILPKKMKKKAAKDGSSLQGSRALNRFSVPIKSETKSQYKKNGVNLNVDSD